MKWKETDLRKWVGDLLAMNVEELGKEAADELDRRPFKGVGYTPREDVNIQPSSGMGKTVSYRGMDEMRVNLETKGMGWDDGMERGSDQAMRAGVSSDSQGMDGAARESLLTAGEGQSAAEGPCEPFCSESNFRNDTTHPPQDTLPTNLDNKQ